jgi:hypothetical protein
MAKKEYTGINIQYPISQMILNGEKTIETRTYPIPKQYINQKMVIIETPGKTGKFKARMIGFVTFDESFEYKNEKEFYKDSKKHCVTPDSIWKWDKRKKKFGWPVLAIEKFTESLSPPIKRGIKTTRGIKI